MLNYCKFAVIFIAMDELLQKPQLISSINYANWGIGLILLILFTLVFQYIFKRFALIASNRRLFASHFLYYSISIFLIITTIKSSLALSLGLVGALSIIRFRTAIKEPEQIIFLLALTAVSIALAAEQFLLSTFTVLIFTAIAIIRNQQYKKHQYIAQDFLLIQFHASAPLASPGILEDLLHINGISQLNLYENNNGNYRLLYQLDQADLALISAVEHKLASLQLEQLSVKISQSLV
jgi:hypothetical protein